MAKFAAKDSNKNITLSPHGTGKVVVGTGAADATVQSDGNHNLVLQTGNATTGSISITDGADGNIAITPNGTGEVDISKVDIDSGAVDGITLGTNSAVTEAQIDNINVNGNAITSTNTDGNIDLTPNGTGEVNISKVDIDSGTIDGVTIGTNSVVTDLRVDNIKVDGNTISATNTDGDITLAPQGTGEIFISGASEAKISAATSQDITIKTQGNVSKIQIHEGANGNIDITPNGTGEVNISKVDIDAGTIDGVTIGDSNTFPDGMVTNTIVRKFELSTNTSYGNSTLDHKIFSRQSDSSATVSSFTAKQGYTYLINMVYYGIGERVSSTTSGRSFTIRMYYGTTTRSQGNTTLDTLLSEGSHGRNMTSAASSGSQTSFTLINMVGSFYHSSADSTIYYYGTSYIGDTSKSVRVYMSSLFPGYDIIHEIKGNKLTTES